MKEQTWGLRGDQLHQVYLALYFSWLFQLFQIISKHWFLSVSLRFESLRQCVRKHSSSHSFSFHLNLLVKVPWHAEVKGKGKADTHTPKPDLPFQLCQAADLTSRMNSTVSPKHVSCCQTCSGQMHNGIVLGQTISLGLSLGQLACDINTLWNLDQKH